MKIHLYSLFFLLLFLFSCDCTYDYEYIIENQTNSTIKIKWDAKFADFPIDSTEIVEGTSQTFYRTSHGVEPCYDGPFFTEVTVDFNSLSIQKDSLFSNRDYLESDQWTYSDGVYFTIITEKEF